ncbi:MAG: NAD(P)/FAD-dependent oxidoreductase [Bacteroidota bacterium]
MTVFDADVLIAGAGPAGLNAALVLARAGRSVVVLDGGPGRNAPAAHAHNVFTRDGTPPSELRRIGREQAEQYGARFIHANAVDAHASEAGVTLHVANSVPLTGRRLLLATGVEDLLPDIPGLAEAWGETVVHCPYCHGYELRGQPTAILGASDQAVHQAGLLLGWTDDVTLCTNGDALADDARARLAGRGVHIDEREVRALEVNERTVHAVAFADGATRTAGAVYIQPAQRPRGPLPDALGLERTEAGHVAVDDLYRTSAPNVWACGDMTTPMQAVPLAAAAGFGAGALINNDLIASGVHYAPAVLR